MEYLLQGITVSLLLAIFLSFQKAKEAKDQGNIKQEKQRKTIGVVCSVAVVIIFSINIVNALSTEKVDDSEPWKTKDNTTMAYVMMQNFVKRNLKSPGTAKFEWITEPDCKITKEGLDYTISSWVDSQNSFGATIRTRFSGVVRQIEEDNWELQSLEFGD